MSDRRDRLVQLLHEAHDQPGPEPTGSLGGHLNGDAILLTGHDPHCRVYTTLRCTCWQRSLRELDHALALLKAEAPVHHGHLAARHLNYAVVRRQVWYRHGRYQTASNEHVAYPQLERGRTPPTQRYDAVLHVWAKWVDPLIVIAALDRLEALYRGEIDLPADSGGRGHPLSERAVA
jgi:hypothetical protein